MEIDLPHLSMLLIGDHAFPSIHDFSLRSMDCWCGNDRNNDDVDMNELVGVIIGSSSIMGDQNQIHSYADHGACKYSNQLELKGREWSVVICPFLIHIDCPSLKYVNVVDKQSKSLHYIGVLKLIGTMSSQFVFSPYNSLKHVSLLVHDRRRNYDNIFSDVSYASQLYVVREVVNWLKWY